MKTSLNGIKFIEKEEGVILYAYDDINDKRAIAGQPVKGTLTIGTGHTDAAGPPKVYVGMVITAAENDKILASDLRSVENEVSHLVKVPLNQNQFDALVSLQFNIGALARSSVLTLLNKGDYQGAADAMLKWSRGNGNPTLLLGRRQRERALFLSKASAPTSSKAAGTAAGAIVAGTVAVTQSPHHYWPYIAAGVAAVIIVGAVITYLTRKQNA